VNDFYLIAKIVSVYKSEGFVAVKPYSDYRERFFRLKSVFIDAFGAKRKFFVEKIESSDDRLLIKFRNFHSASDADFLVGKNIYVKKQNLFKLPENSFYIHDLIGSKVFRNGKFFGELIDVLQLPSNYVYVIRNVERHEAMIPSSKDYIESFNPEKKELVLRANCDLLYNDEN